MNKLTMVAVLAALAGTGTVAAQTKPDGLWHGTAAAGLSVASGNSSSNALSLNADMARETTADKTTFYGLATRASSKNALGVSTTTSDLFRLGGRYEYNITPVLYGYGGLEFERDGVADLDLRTLLSAGLGYKVIRSATTTFDIFGGIAYVNAQYGVSANDTSGVALQFGEESTHKLSATSNFKQRLVITPAKSDVGTRATWDLSFNAAVANNLSMNVGLGYRYASKVPTGAKKGDTLLIVGVGYKF